MNIEKYEQEARENSAQFLSEMNFEKFAAWTEKYIVDLSLAGTAFRAIIREGEDKDRAIIIPGEFGNGLRSYGAAARGEVIRQYMQLYTNTDPSLIILPNTTIGEDNVNLTRAERNRVKNGSAEPLVDRMNVAMQYVIGDQAGKVTVYGPSQGGMPALESAAQRERSAVAVTETPDVAEHTPTELIHGFFTSSSLLKDEISANFEEADVLRRELMSDLSNPIGMARYFLGGARRDNLALMKMLLHGGAGEKIEAILASNGSVVQTWAGSGVSPGDVNRAIAREYGNHPRYMSVEYPGRDHSVTNNYAAAAAAVRMADELRDLPDEA